MPIIFEDSSPANVTCSHCGILEYLQNLYIERGGGGGHFLWETPYPWLEPEEQHGPTCLRVAL